MLFRSKETHRERVNQLLGRLQKLDLYLKPDKCIFETDRVEFLGVILENGMVTMDPIKVAGVADWKPQRMSGTSESSLDLLISTDVSSPIIQRRQNL